MAPNIAGRKDIRSLVRQNLRLAKYVAGGELNGTSAYRLRSLTSKFGFSLALGDLQYLNGGWYVTHAGLLRLARQDKCSGIRVAPVHQFCDPAVGRWIFKATVYKHPGSKGFVGFGDADPFNVSYLVRGAEMRVAETRAVNRALRKAYGIGLCSVEEIGSFPAPAESRGATQKFPVDPKVSGNGHPRLRDRLCQIIRQYQLDPTQVKCYAADFCGTKSLRDAKREKVEDFIGHLARLATEDRAGLLCVLNGYNPTQEVSS